MTDKRIRNLEQFCAAHDAGPEWHSIERATYKYTDCGAWISHKPRAERTERPERFEVEVVQSIGRVIPRQWRRLGKAWQPLAAAPEGIRQFCEVDPDTRTLADLRAAVIDLHGADAVRYKSSMRDVYRCATTTAASRPVEGITVGSIVEGSDADVGPVFLAYPFTMAQFWSALEDVNAEACALWDEANRDEADRAAWKVEG
jgi:hypothetical protein